MAHNTYRLAEGNGYAARTIDTFGKEDPFISLKWFLEPLRVRRSTRQEVAKQLRMHRASGLPIERQSEDWEDDSEYPNLSAQIRHDAVLNR
jgi:hypothetical protein